MAPPLVASDEPTIRAADPSFIRAALMGLATRGTWLRAGHPNPDGSVPKNKAQFDAILANDVIELLAILGPLHSVDGWSYLARALSALMAGDPHAARHLAYYAELRGALSMLANSGVGIFNSQNRIVDANGNLRALQGRNTHDMCWTVLEFWGKEATSVHSILTSIEINGGTLLDALFTYFPGLSVSGVGAQLIKEWGFDLQLGHRDHFERNLSSYSPNVLTPVGMPPEEDAAFLRPFWSAFEPKSWVIERHLLRKLLELQQTIVGGAAIGERVNEYSNLDARVRAYVSAEFLSRVSEPNDHPLLAAASDSTNPARAHSMIARGALLLKIATATSEQNLTAATIRPFQHLKLWWTEYGSARGLWAPNSEPFDMTDLWLEVEDALDAVSPATPGNRHAWFSQLQGAVVKLCETERIALWRLCQ